MVVVDLVGTLFALVLAILLTVSLAGLAVAAAIVVGFVLAEGLLYAEEVFA